MFSYNKVSSKDVEDMRMKYYKNLTAPMDDMWEHGIIPKGDYYEIVHEHRIGYFVLDDKKAILQFYLEHESRYNLDTIFQDVLKKFNIEHALVSTYDPIFLSLCMEESKGVEINSILYRGINTELVAKPIETMVSLYAVQEDFQRVIDYHEQKAGFHGVWLREYCKNLILKRELILYMIGDEIIGTGEMRHSLSSPEYCNVGMTVASDYRRKGIGSYILSDLKELAKQAELKVICSTSSDNIASQKTILKSGFFPYNRILDVRFS